MQPTLRFRPLRPVVASDAATEQSISIAVDEELQPAAPRAFQKARRAVIEIPDVIRSSQTPFH